MPLYRLTQDRLDPVQVTSFAEQRVLERRDIQRLLKADISALGDDLMVIAEEFGDWEESNRRIDLLCLDTQARLVVVEIKRTEDGGYMELQAIRYAAMVSSMTLEQAIGAYAKLLGGEDASIRAEKEVLEFLDFESTGSDELTGEVRIILVSADFSAELTTAVIWLNKHELDLRCIRLLPYKLGDQLLIDVTQIIPLPEAANYEIKIREQEKETRKARSARQETFRRFWAQLIERSRESTRLLANRSTSSDHWLSAGIGRAGFGLNFTLTEERARVECFINLDRGGDGRSKQAFRALLAQKDLIERTFGEPLDWQELPDRIGSRICKDLVGGWRTPEAEWPALQEAMLEAMLRLERALKEPIHRLTI
jgi:hypothetical protein